MALNNTSDLENELRGAGAEYSDLDLNRFLRKANNKLPGIVGRKFIDRKTIRFEDETDVELAFNSLESFDKVVDNSSNDIIDASNYTEDLSTGTVSFTQSFVDDNFFQGLELEFFYIPSIFRDLELEQAAELVESQEQIVTNDGVQSTDVDRRRENIKMLMKDINSRASTGVQRGDNTNRGSNAPDSYNRS